MLAIVTRAAAACRHGARHDRDRHRRWSAAGRALAGVMLLVVSSVAPPGAAAHPHSWIDLRSTLQFNDQGKIAAIGVDWLFDDFYSAFVLEELIEDPDNVEAGLITVARENIVNLREFDYFTEVTADGRKVALRDVETFETGVSDGRVWLRFVVLLETPVDPYAEDVRLAVYDPTYYIEILHVGQPGAVSLRGPGSEFCTPEIVKPAPTQDEVTFATALDKTQSGGNDLGAAFAERVALTCRTPGGGAPPPASPGASDVAPPPAPAVAAAAAPAEEMIRTASPPVRAVEAGWWATIVATLAGWWRAVVGLFAGLVTA